MGGQHLRLFVKRSLVLLLVALGWAAHAAIAQSAATISGVVVDSDGPIAGARVRIRATETLTFTDEDGRFTLEAPQTGSELEITAWAAGYYIAHTTVTPPAEDVLLELRPYHTQDHSDYTWARPYGQVEGEDKGTCAECHPLIVPQWRANAHGQALENPRFFSLYNGTDIDGVRQVPPGYVLDFPGTAGPCASCHAPGAAVDGYLTVDMNAVRDQPTAGIFCDYCHKVGGVYLNPADRLPYPNVPGVESQRVLRPPADDDIFFGPYDDIHDPDTYLPVMRESAYCAPCHQFSMWGTPIYTSYSEWLASDYAAHGVTCQDCHMPPTGDTVFALPERGGLEHPAEQIPSHLQLGATDAELLQAAVEMHVEAAAEDGALTVTVTVTNTGAGHHIPTDFPGRHMILTVEAQDADGAPLPLLDGPTVPDWGGAQAGQAGTVFAKVLRDVRSGDAPVVSYWRPAQIVSDSRLPALASDTSRYTFALPNASAEVTVSARLIFRRVFAPVAQARAWDVPDITLAETQTTVLPN